MAARRQSTSRPPLMDERFVALLPRIAQGGAHDALTKATGPLKPGQHRTNKYGFGPVTGDEDLAEMDVNFLYCSDVERGLNKDNPAWETSPIIPRALEKIDV